MTTTYHFSSHLEMMLDPVRMPAFREAIRRTVKPGDLVVDLGAGAGVITFLALRAGARHVFAIEPGDAVEVLRQVARDNQLTDRITIWQEDSRRVELPEPADVLIADLRGVLPVLGDNLAVIRDAVSRHLRPGGRLLPERDRMCLAPVSAADAFRAVDGWRREHGADYSRIAQLAANIWTGNTFGPGALLAPARVFPALDYRELSLSPLRFSAQYTVEKEGELHGIGAWFETDLMDDVSYSTGPDQPETVYGRAVFPFTHAHRVRVGDAVTLELGARIGPRKPVWSWRLGIGTDPSAWEEHDSFRAELINTDQLRKRGHRYVPTLGPEGALQRFLLDQMDGVNTLDAIAREAYERFPDRFTDLDDALAAVGNVSAAFGR